MPDKLIVEWVDGKREPQNPPDPAYPNGVDFIAAPGRPHCSTKLPYPAKRCGYYVITCESCGMRVAVTTAGRVDDPRYIEVPCKGH